MTIVIGRITVVPDEIVAVNIVDIPVLIVVDARLTIGFRLIDPRVRGEVRDLEINPGVDHRDHDVTGTGRDVPGFFGTNVHSLQAAGAAFIKATDIVQTPELSIFRIIGSLDDPVNPIGLGDFDGGIVVQKPKGSGLILIRIALNEDQIRPDLIDDPRV